MASNSLASLGPLEALHDGYCRRCKRSGRLDARALLGRHGDLPLNKLRRRLRCIACGARDAELLCSTRLPP